MILAKDISQSNFLKLFKLSININFKNKKNNDLHFYFQPLTSRPIKKRKEQHALKTLIQNKLQNSMNFTAQGTEPEERPVTLVRFFEAG